MPTVAELLRDHVTLQVESLDRIYLNGYVPKLRTSGQLVDFLRRHRRQPIPSPALLDKMTKGFVAQIQDFAQQRNIPIIPFKRGERKDDVASALRKKYPIRDGVVFVGVAQEKARAFKSHKETRDGKTYFRYSRQDVFVNHYYFYIEDEDFGPGFIKICSYFPFPIKVCINGHEWAKRQMDKLGVAYESLDNGFLSCQQPEVLQRICDQLGPDHIEAFFRKWVDRLPFPLTVEDRLAGYRHELSIWQMEQSLTQIVARPVHGREFFEEVIRENLDLGRPERIEIVFDRKVQKNTPGRFSTRVITEGVLPSLHVRYKATDLKQYFKDNRGLRTETTINHTDDFGIGKSLKNLPYLVKIARNTNHRLLEVEKVSENCVLSDQSAQRLTQPTVTQDGQRAPGMKFGDPRTMALFAALCLFLHLPDGFRNRNLRRHVAHLLGVDESEYGPSQMTYDLRRLRLKGLISKIPGTTRYFLTPYGYHTSLFLTRLNARLLRPGFACMDPDPGVHVPHPLRTAFERVNREIDAMLEEAHMKRVA